MKLWKKLIIAVIAAILIGACGTAVIIIKDRIDMGKTGRAVSAPASSDTPEAKTDGVNTEKTTQVGTELTGMVTTSDVSDIVTNVMPAIVSIDSTAVYTQMDFFGRKYEKQTQGSGSGIIIGQNNGEILVVTNNHVIDGASELNVRFCDGKTAEAEIKGTDEPYDLAVLTVNVSLLDPETIGTIRVATLGRSDDLSVGDMAIAIGNALGYGQSVTVGYISALNRDVTLDDATRQFIQTDAAINPGNSGGALLDVHGAVIGINSAKYADEAVEGMGYAIPISQAVPIINELMNREELSVNDQGYIGIEGEDISKAYAEGFNMPVGIYVSGITEGAPADVAGLKLGNIIVGFNGRPITTMDELQTILSYTRAGTTAELQIKVLENGKYIDRTLSVVLGSRSDAPKKEQIKDFFWRR